MIMRNVNHHLLEDKIDEAVTHYINHEPSESVHVDGSLALNIQEDEGGRVVAVMNPQNFPSQMCRQVSVGEHMPEGAPWGEEILESESRLAALVAHLTQNSRNSQPTHHKITSVRGDVEASVMLDAPMRMFNTQTLDHQSEPIVVQLPQLPPLPPLQEMKRCQDTDWFNSKAKNNMKNETTMLDSDGPVLELTPGASPGPKQQSKKSLPHKKRISRKLKRNTGNTTPQQEIMVLNCSEDVPQEEILPDSFVAQVQQTHMTEETHHAIAHEVRPVLICQLCGEYYGEDQVKFFHHLKQHYEPHATIIIENPVPDLGIDKMTNTCMEDSVATLPDSIVELSLENTVPKTMYQTIDKHILYTSSEKTLHFSSNKVQYSIANIDKEVPNEVEKSDLYESLDKLGIYNCVKCNKSFRKQKQCETHIKEVHGKLEDMGEFSEPEDLMEGIHVAVEEAEGYEHTLPHLTVDNGHVRQDHVRHWYMRGAGGAVDGAVECAAECAGAEDADAEAQAAGDAAAACAADGAYCPVCPAHSAHPAHPMHAAHSAQPAHPAHPAHPAPSTQETHHLKEEVFQRIFEVEVPPTENTNFAENMISDEMPEEVREESGKPEKGKKGSKLFECPHCGRVFQHRNSLLYHLLSHKGKQHICRECNKEFYTPGALKIHKRVHSGDRPYRCEICQREFRQWSDLKYHKVSLHSDQKHFKCEFCGKEFARKYSLSVHRRIHTGERNYKCEYCNKSFRASSYRLSHMRTHTGDKPFECMQCGKCFRVAGDLRRHALTHEKVRTRFDKPVVRVKEEKEDKSPKQNKSQKEPVKSKKIATASTTKQPILKSILDKKSPKSKKDSITKMGAPNVTVNPNKDEGQFKLHTDYSNIDVFDTRSNYKFKDVYVNKDQNLRHYEIEDESERISDERNFAVLKPLFRSPNGNDDNEKIYTNRTENTDGKMTVFTQVEKKEHISSIVPNSQLVSLSDMRHFEREARDVRPDPLNGEGIENGFLEKLAALYNIPAV